MSTSAKALDPLINVIADRVIERMGRRGFLSVQHAAEYLDCSRHHVQVLLDRGELQGIDIGTGAIKKTIRISVKDLDRYVELKRRAA